MDHLSLLQVATELSRGNITMRGYSRVSKPLVALFVLEQLRQQPGHSPISHFQSQSYGRKRLGFYLIVEGDAFSMSV